MAIPESERGRIYYSSQSIDVLISMGVRPRVKESLESGGDWKTLAYFRHLASLALTKHREILDFTTFEERLEWVKETGVLLDAEIQPIIENKFVLPHPQKLENLNVVSNFNPDKEKWTGIYMEDPETLKWYEPSNHFMMFRIQDQLKIPDRTVGFTSGKWRFITAAHLSTLWEMRQNCDFMTVGIDPKEHDESRVSDGFVPEYEEKASFLRAITFPDGRKIDLMFETHFEGPETWFSNIYLPFILTESFIKKRLSSREDIEDYLKVFKDPEKFHLKEARKRFDPTEAERRERLFYFLSEGDPFLRHKRLLVSIEGYEVKELSFQEWKANVSASRLVEQHDLGNL